MADYFGESEKKHVTTVLKVVAVIELLMEEDVAASAPTAFGELMETADTGLGKLQMPQVNSRPGVSHMRLGSCKSQSHKYIASLLPSTVPYSSIIINSNTVEPLSYLS